MTLARVLIVVVGILLPYAVRALGIPSHGTSWFTSYVGRIDAILFIGAFNAICWTSVVACTLTYRDVRSVWFPVLLGFGVLAYFHFRINQSTSSTAAIGLLFAPIYSLPFVLAGWLIGLVFDRLVFTSAPTDAAADTGQFSLRSLLIVVVLVATVCSLLAWQKRRMDANLRENLRHAILDGEIDPESARTVLGNEVDTLRPSILTQEEIRALARAEVSKRTSHPADQLEETVQFIGGRWRVVVWKLPKTPSGYYVVTLSKSGRVDEFVLGE